MKISVLVPFRAEAGEAGRIRRQNWEWLEQRWKVLLPEAEIVTGTDDGQPFSKTCAVNDAYSRASGDVFVIADADSWVPVRHVRSSIEYVLRRQVLVVPWTIAHRLTAADTIRLRRLDPSTEHPFTQAMRKNVSDYRPSPSTAAMVIVVTREGFERVGGMDPRFRGWGAEDVAFGLACGALLGLTKIILGEAYALYHKRPRENGKRVWENDTGLHNVPLGERYWAAKGDPAAMTELCQEHPLAGAVFPVGPGPGAVTRPPETYVPQLASNVGFPQQQVRRWDGMRTGDSVQI